MPPLELTLVLAATRDMGIGLNGSLPWTGLKKEMAYFARVTKRLPPHVCLFFPFTDVVFAPAITDNLYSSHPQP